MIYKRNVPMWKRILRAVMGAGLIAAHMLLHLHWALMGLGIVGLVTGSIGFCPACAMVGRRPVNTKKIGIPQMGTRQ